jgi:hypothetical protein
VLLFCTLCQGKKYFLVPGMKSCPPAFIPVHTHWCTLLPENPMNLVGAAAGVARSTLMALANSV